MPDFLPVRLQNELRHRKPAVRKQEGQQITTENAAGIGRHFYIERILDSGGISNDTLL